MNELHLHAPRPVPYGGIIGIGLSAVFLLLAALQDSYWAMIAAPFGLVGLALLLTQRPPFSGRLTDQAVEIHDPPETIPYANLEGIWANGRCLDPSKAMKAAVAIDLAHVEGTLHIPPMHNPPSRDLYRFLFGRFSPSGSRDVHPSLSDYLQQQIATFGADRVWSYVARQHLGQRLNKGRRIAVSLAIAAAGGVWIVAGVSVKGWDPWAGLGAVVAFFAAVFALLFAMEKGRYGGKIANWRQSSMVISPLGLALFQGDVRGQMRWDELRKVRLNTHRESFNNPALVGIVLDVEAAQIVIHDLYDRPLPLIMQKIKGYWRPNR